MHFYLWLMEKEFWINRWKENQIGFHQMKANPYLIKYLDQLKASGSHVFFPLCGKSGDMIYAAEHGFTVSGVELSSIACDSFFKENKIDVRIKIEDSFAVYRGGPFTIYCGDFFHLSESNMANISSVFDRASLIALPSEMRRKYASHMTSILPANSEILLVTMEYPKGEMNGPPFSVSSEEVFSLYESTHDIKMLEEIDAMAENPNLKDRGVTSMYDRVFLLTEK